MDSQNWQYVSFLSIFDHWLTVIEADNCKILTYSIAKCNNALAEYLIGENKFIKFYQLLDTQVNIISKPKMPCISTTSKNFQGLLKKRLKEKARHDFYFPNQQILAEMGFDRTDRLFCKDEHSLKIIHDLSQKCGLALIETMDYQDYQKSLESF